MGEHGASFSGESIYDDTDEGKGVVRIAAVAALGGFLFGYDSAVINGANSAIESQFNADAGCAGLRGRVGAARRRRRCVDRRPDRRPHRPADGDADRRDPVLRRAIGTGLSPEPHGCWSSSGSSAVSVSVSPRSSRRPTSPRSRRPSCAADSGPCSNSRSSPASSSRCWSTSSSPSVAGGSSARLVARPGGLAVDVHRDGRSRPLPTGCWR